MSWATKKVMEYKNGATSSWLERRNLEHANPALFTLIVIGGAIAIYGLWEHDWTAIVATAVIGLLGHIFVWTRK